MRDLLEYLLVDAGELGARSLGPATAMPAAMAFSQGARARYRGTATTARSCPTEGRLKSNVKRSALAELARQVLPRSYLTTEKSESKKSRIAPDS